MIMQAGFIKSTITAATIVAVIGLTGCASDGSNGMAGATGPSAAAGTTGPAGAIGTTGPQGPAGIKGDPVVQGVVELAGVRTLVTGVAGVVTTSGGVVNGLGSSIAAVSLPGGNSAVTAALGGTVKSTGAIVSTLGATAAAGLGQIGINPDPIGTTLAGVPLVVGLAGVTVSGVGKTVGALDDGSLSALAPVITPVGALVDRTGLGITVLAVKLDAAVVRNIPTKAIMQITPITQTLLANLQTPLSGASPAPGGLPVIGILTPVTALLTGLGNPGTGSPATGALAPVTGIVSGLAGTGAGASGGAGAGAGLGGLTPVIALVTGLGTNNPATGILAPVTGLVSGLVGGTNTGGLGLSRR